MKILMEECSYEGSALEIVGQMKADSMFGDECPTMADYLEYMRETFTRMTDVPCHLDGNEEERAQGLLDALASVDAITVLED